MAVSILRRVLFVAAALSGLAWEALASAAPMSIRVPLTGAEQVPPVQTSGKGTAQLTYDPDTESRDLDGRVQRALGPGHDGPFSRPAMAGKNAPPTIWLTKKGSMADSPIKGEATLTPEQAQEFTSGQWYINVRTARIPMAKFVVR